MLDMAVASINFNKVIEYSKKNCATKSLALCATYVKRAFEAGGCQYISGNGWECDNFCRTNGFKCIGDFVPVDKNPRAHGSLSIQFPSGYTQQIGDICLIKHGTYGHICYATGTGLNDWVSDFWQRPPGQVDGSGPYCYRGDVEQVQFWRHSSCMNGAPEVDPSVANMSISTSTASNPSYSGGGGVALTGNVTPQSISSFSDIDGSGDTDNRYSTVLGTAVRQK